MILRFAQLLMILTALGGATHAAPRVPGEPAQGDIRLARGSRVEIQNSNGPITVTGGETETLHVVARYEDSGNPATVDVRADTSGGSVHVMPSRRDRGEGGSVQLEVQVPHYVSLPSVSAGSGDVVITGVAGDVRVMCGSGNVRLANVGAVYVRASSGDVVVEGASGASYIEASSGNVTARGIKGNLTFKAGSGDARVEGVEGAVDATLASGSLALKNAAGAVRVAAISGDVTIEGSGPVQVQSASGNIELSGVAGDCDVKTASGNVSYSGAVTAEHSYKLRSMSGDAVMRICGDVPGFTVTLRSYSGEIETEFALKVDRPALVSRGLTGRYGDGSTQIEIEAFSGSAKVLKCQQSAPAPKKQK